jgi:TolB-like protein/Flp pilus assembly protein TadD
MVMPENPKSGAIQNFFSELERRRTYRVAIGYLAVSWMLLEASDMIFPRLGLPDGSVDVMLILVGLGFPIALILSWTYDITADGIVKTAPARRPGRLSGLQVTEILVIFVLLVALSYLIVERESSPAVAPVDRYSIGVLPFVDMSPDNDNEYFGDGISEELLNALANVKQLRVAARTSSFYYKNKNLSVKEIGLTLGVGLLLEGSVRKDGNKLRITAQLINTINGYHEWSGTYDRELKDVFGLQQEITREVVSAITPLLLPKLDLLKPAAELAPESYSHYLRGRDFLRSAPDSASLALARQEFETALQLSPTFALPYAGLCDVSLKVYDRYRDPSIFAAAETACKEALVRQQDSSRSWEIHAAHAELYRNAGNYEKSLNEIAIAIQSHPYVPRLHISKGMTLAAMGQAGLAETTMLRGLELDERNWNSLILLGNFYYDEQRYDESIAKFQEVLNMVPDYAAAMVGLGSAQYMSGQEAAGLASWSRAESHASDADAGMLGIVYTNLGLTHYYQGDYERAAALQRKATQLRPADHRPWGRLAESYRHLDQLELEQQAYQQAIKLAMQELKVDPNDGETLGLLGIYSAFTGQSDKAELFRQKMLLSDPNNSTWLLFASLTNFALQRYDQAFADLEGGRELGLDPRFIREDPDLKNLEDVNPERFGELLRY